MHEVLVKRLGGLSLPRKSVVRLTDCPDMTLDVYRGRKTTIQQQQRTKKPFCVTQNDVINNFAVVLLKRGLTVAEFADSIATNVAVHHELPHTDQHYLSFKFCILDI